MELTQAERQFWRKVLSSEAGVKVMLYLRENTPSIHKGLPHEVQFDAGVSQGWGRCLDRISSIAESDVKKDIDASND